MANYCFTKYAIEGNKEILEKVANAINDGDGYMKTALDNLGVEVSEEEVEYLGRAEWETGATVTDENGTSVLRFTQAYPWYHEEVIAPVLEELGEKDARIYRLIELFESDCHETDDAEGKYFPGRFHVFTDEDEDDLYFVTEEEALAHIRKQLQLPADLDTLEKMEDYCDSHDLFFAFDEIEVVNEIESWITAKSICGMVDRGEIKIQGQQIQ